MATRSPAPEEPAAMTLEAWAALGEDVPGELVDGRLVEEEVADYVHELVVAWLIEVLRAWVARRGAIVGGSEAKLAVGAHRGRKADVSLYLPDSPKPPRRGLVRVPPDLLVEVISSTPRDARRDRIDKPDEYAGFGVRFYWLIDPETRILECYELDEQGRYVRTRAAGGGEVTVPGFEGLLLDLDALWMEVERLPE